MERLVLALVVSANVFAAARSILRASKLKQLAAKDSSKLRQPGSARLPDVVELPPDVQDPCQLYQPGGTGLLDLPPEVLDNILALLPVRERLHLLSCCRQLHLLAATSASMAGIVSKRLPAQRWEASLQELAAALGQPGAAGQLTRLHIDLRAALQSQWSRQHVFSLLVTVSLYSLEGEDFNFSPKLRPKLSQWVAALRRLHSILLRSQHMSLRLPKCPEYPKGFLRPSNVGAGALQELHIYARFGDGSRALLQPGCLPPSPQRLELNAQGVRRLPAVTPAGQLTELCVWAWYQRVDLAGLARLTGLRRLALRDMSTSEALFGLLAKLPRLDSLDLSAWNDDGGVEIGSSLHGITQLRSLRELCLGNRWLPYLPPWVLNMPTLTALHLEGNPRVRLPPEAAKACQLRVLTLDRQALSTINVRTVDDMPHLQQLHVTNCARQA